MAHARATGTVPEALAEAALQAALRRERLASTAVGGGLALPHAKVEALPRVAGVLGHAEPGVAWASPDGQAVRLVCLLLLRPRGGDNVRFCESVAAYFRGRGHGA